MKILILSRRFPPDVYSGSETVIATLWEMAKRQYEAFLCCGWHNDKKLVPQEAFSVNLANKNKYLRYILFTIHCKRVIQKTSPDLILANTMGYFFSNIPTILIIHDFNFGQSNDNHKVSLARKFTIRWNLEKTTKIVAVGSHTKKRILEFGIKEDKVAVIHNGVDLERFYPSQVKNNDSDSKFKIVYPSRIFEGKGQHIAIEAYKALKKEIRDNATLIIVGFIQDYAYFSHLKKIADGYDIRFFINVENIVHFYQLADVIVFPTIMEEGFGFTALEGMACGKPVIYSDQPAIAEATGKIGLSFKYNDKLELAKMIETLFYDQELRERIEKDGRAFVEANRRWDLTFDRYKDLFHEITRIKI